MAINKKLIHFEKRDNFDTRLANNEINDTSIVFIQDTGELWTHGLFFCTTATNLLEAPSLLTVGDTIAVQIGDKTSNYIVPPAALKGRTMYECITATTDTRGHWTGTIPGVTELYDGLVIHVRFTTSYYGNGEGYNTLNINNLGPKLIWWRYNSILTSHWGSNTEITLTYRTTAGSYKVSNAKGELTNGTTYTDGWVADFAYYTYTDYMSGSYYYRYKVNANGYIGRYMIVMRCPDGTITGLTTTNNSTATTKTMFSGPLLLDDVHYYSSTNTYAANTVFTHDGGSMRNNAGLVDVRYTFNCGSTLVANKSFFIVGTIGNDGYFYLDQTQPWSLDYPTTEDNKLYILIGPCFDNYRVNFELYNPIYIFKNGKLLLYSLYAAETEWANITGKPSTFTPSTHTHPYTDLTGSTTTADLAIVSSGTANGWTLKTLGSNAFNSTAYLPLAGGTMTGPINWGTGSTREVLLFSTNSTWKAGLRYSWNSNTTVALWGKHKNTQFVWNAGADSELNGTTTKTYDFLIGRDTSGTYNDTVVGRIAGNIIWHAGNDGSDSGLDADLLDGKHAADFALSNHLYHKLTVNENYYESYSGENLFSIVTKNFRYDNLRFRSSTITDVQYWNYTTNEWQSWSKDLSPLFNGSGETNVSIPKENRKFRFCITSSSGWPATAMFVLLGNYHNAGTITTLNGNYSNVIIETRNSNTEFVEKASFGFSTSFMGTNARVLNSLHTGDTIYRITIELASWTTENNAALKMIAIFSNYGNLPLQVFRHDGYGNIYPITTSKYALGVSSYRWNGIYTTSADLSTTLKVAGAVTFSGLDSGTSDVIDGTEFLTSYASANGFSTSGYVGKVYKRPVSKLYNYLKGKFDTLYLGTSGNATTATEFASAQSVTLTGDTTGTASSKAGWSIETTTKYLSGTKGANLTESPGSYKISYRAANAATTTGLFPVNDNSNSVLTLNRHLGNYDSQLGFSSNGNIYYRNFDGAALNTTTPWKQIAFTDSNITGQASYAANVGSAGTLGTNYVAASKVIAACNWYDTVTGSDTDSVINRWDEIVNFVAGFEETPDLATYLANNYLAKTGNSTSSPMTGTIYVKDVNPLVLLSTNLDLDIWRVTGDNASNAWDNAYGFYLRYNGAGSGNDNSLSLWANNQTGNDVEVYRVKLDGVLNFLTAPTINGTAISLTTHDHDDRYLKLTGGTLTGELIIDSNTIGGNPHLTFTRSTYSYIKVPTGGTLSFAVGDDTSVATTYLAVTSTAVYPGAHNKTIDLGTTDYRWNITYTKIVGLNTNLICEISNGSRVSVTNYSTVPTGFNAKDFMASDTFTDYTKVPTNGIYAKGNIRTSGNVQVGTGGTNSYVASDSASNIYLHNSSGAVLVVDGLAVRCASSTANATLGTSDRPWNSLYVNTININSNKGGAEHINFNRAGYNYINIPTNGTFAVSFNTSTIANSYFTVEQSATYPGQHNGTVDLGTSSYQWNNLYAKTIYQNGSNIDSLYVTSVDVTDDTTNHANQLRYVKNGVSTYFTVPYATNADTVDGYHETSFFRSRGLIDTSYVDLTTYTANAEGYINPKNGMWSVPRGGYSEGLVTFTGSGSTTGLDLWFHYSKGNFFRFRRRIDSNRVSGAWETFITDLNYTSYTVKKDGTGASGTWGISISGTAATASNLNKSTLGYLYQSATTTTGSTGTVTATSGKIGVPIQFYGSQVNYALNNDLFYATVASNAITANTIYLGDNIKSKTFVKTSTHVPTGASSSSSSSGTSGESITYTAGNGIKIAGTQISTNTWTGTESLFAELANPSSYDLIYIIED